MAWEHIELGFDDSIATITLNRPDALNAFAGSMRADLLAAIDEAAQSARVLVLTGAGKAFCSGGDVRALASMRAEGSGDELKLFIEQGKNVVKRLSSLPIPTLASVNGVAAGAGFSLALACDLRVASNKARFGASFARIGLHPDWGGIYFLTRLGGAAVARDLIFSGRLIDAEEALTLGSRKRCRGPRIARRSGRARRRSSSRARRRPRFVTPKRESRAQSMPRSMRFSITRKRHNSRAFAPRMRSKGFALSVKNAVLISRGNKHDRLWLE